VVQRLLHPVKAYLLFGTPSGHCFIILSLHYVVQRLLHLVKSYVLFGTTSGHQFIV
jgi:uncharacterized membrane protein